MICCSKLLFSGSDYSGILLQNLRPCRKTCSLKRDHLHTFEEFIQELQNSCLLNCRHRMLYFAYIIAEHARQDKCSTSDKRGALLFTLFAYIFPCCSFRLTRVAILGFELIFDLCYGAVPVHPSAARGREGRDGQRSPEWRGRCWRLPRR